MSDSNNLMDKNTEEVIELYGESIKELKRRGVIRTKNVIGELGEYLAVEYYTKTPGLPNLILAPKSTENIDAISRNGERYSIKSVTGSSTGKFHNLGDPDDPVPAHPLFEYVIICIFDENIMLQEILELDWKTFLDNRSWHKTDRAWQLTITRKLREQCKVIYQKS